MSSIANPPAGAPLRSAAMDIASARRGGAMTPWLLAVMVVVVFAGGLFGYDQGVISGALAGVKRTFSLSPLLVEVVTSWVTLGALAGSLIGGELADRIGRRPTVLVAAAAFVLGAAVQAIAPDVRLLVLGRLAIGAGVGVAAVAAPLYAAELAPAALRGRFVACYQLAITIGIFLAYLVDGALSGPGAWRWMLGAAAAPGLLLLAAGIAAPESPRWLMKAGRRADAARQAERIDPKADVARELDAIAGALREERGDAPWTEMFQPRWRRPLMIGLGLAVFQQITGINAIIYYADQIFASAGFASPAAQTTATTWAIGAVNVVSTLIAVATIDRIGRRRLLLVGLVGMGLSLVLVGAAFLFVASRGAGGGPSLAGIATLIGLVAFIVSFAFSLGPAVWTVINEIFPARIRGRAVALCTATNWGAAFLVSQFFLSLVGALGSAPTFWLLALLCVAGWIWIFAVVPETRGRTLEEIEADWNA